MKNNYQLEAELHRVQILLLALVRRESPEFLDRLRVDVERDILASAGVLGKYTLLPPSHVQ